MIFAIKSLVLLGLLFLALALIAIFASRFFRNKPGVSYRMDNFIITCICCCPVSFVIAGVLAALWMQMHQ